MKEIDNETLTAVLRHLEVISKDIFENMVIGGTDLEKAMAAYVLSLIDLQKQRAEMEFALYEAKLTGGEK